VKNFKSPIPPEIVDWIRGVFESVNARVSLKLTRFPTTHETSLDMSLIEEVSQHSAPVRFHSGWTVHLETHYLGGGKYWGRWEIADIGLLIVFRQAGVTLGTKIALLQSKRLYPVEAEASSEDLPVDYLVGFGRLLKAEQEYKSSVKPRKFSFVEESCYRALEYQGLQFKAILRYQDESDVPVHYLLYNPLSLPISIHYPVEASQASVAGDCQLGARVISAVTLNEKLKRNRLKKLDNPTYDDIFVSLRKSSTPPWTLQYFVADLVLGCKEGHVAGINPIEDSALFRVFNRRSGPISAAIAITIDAPAEAAP
jgi:hypothetical protein